jgi:hypothetical protein
MYAEASSLLIKIKACAALELFRICESGDGRQFIFRSRRSISINDFICLEDIVPMHISSEQSL